MNVKPGKTEAMIINSKDKQLNSLWYGDTELCYVENSKVLGLWLDNKLSWKKQISVTRGKVWHAWFEIRKLCNQHGGLRISTIVNLIKIMVLSRMFYCAPVWLYESIQITFKMSGVICYVQQVDHLLTHSIQN